jgi:hypothetical protein
MPPPAPRNNSNQPPAVSTTDPAKAVSVAMTALNAAIGAFISQSPKKDAARRRCVKQVYHLLGRLLDD